MYIMDVTRNLPTPRGSPQEKEIVVRASWRSFTLRYGFALVSVVAAVGLRRSLDPWLQMSFPFATVFFAILLTVWVGGLKPALTAVLLGAIASDYFLLSPRGSFKLDETERLGLVLFVFTGLGIAALGGVMDRARRSAELYAAALRVNNENLETRVQERTAELQQKTEKLAAEIAQGARSKAKLLDSVKEISDLKTALD
jgi:K+-sensing histidine kinase KdpD